MNKKSKKDKIMSKKVSRRAFASTLGKGAVAAAALSIGAHATTKKVYGANIKTSKTGKLKVKLESAFPLKFPGLGYMSTEFAKEVELLSSGKIEFDMKTTGFKSIANVMSGKAQVCTFASYYLMKKAPAQVPFTAVPFGMDAIELYSWVHEGGGQEIWDEISAKMGLKGLMTGNTGHQAGGWFNKKIRSTRSFNGLKIRYPGIGGQVLKKLGATVVNLPGGKIPGALKSGEIDACEWVGPMNDILMKFYENAKYYYTSSWHETGSALVQFINLDFYNSLDETERTILTSAANSVFIKSFSNYEIGNARAFPKLKKLGVNVQHFPRSVIKGLYKASQEVLDEYSKKDSDFAKVMTSYNSFRKTYGAWNKESNYQYLYNLHKRLKV